MMRPLVLAAAIAALAAACTSPEPAVVRVMFPNEDAGVIPYGPGGAFAVRVEATVPGLVGTTRARIELAGPGGPDGGPPSTLVTLSQLPDDREKYAGDVTLRHPPGGNVTLVVTAVGQTQTVVARLAEPPSSASVRLTPRPAVLPPPGRLVEIGVQISGGASVASVPVSLELVPPTPIVPSSPVTDRDGGVTVRFIVPPDATTMRVEAVAGGARDGVTLVASGE